MKLANNLYTLKAIDAQAYCATIALCPDCIIYKVHFPEQPITPGVCIIQMATELLGQILKTKLEMAELKNAKFLSIISPETMSEIQYTFQKTTIDVQDGIVKTNVIVSSGKVICAKLSLRYKVI